jgi:hypothetical protein
VLHLRLLKLDKAGQLRIGECAAGAALFVVGVVGFQIGPTTVRRLLKKLKYRLFGNCQSLTPRHPDRDKQFRYIRRIRKLFLATGRPVISVDTKKKELIGNVKNAGRIWEQSPTLVNTHGLSFRSSGAGNTVWHL